MKRLHIIFAIVLVVIVGGAIKAWQQPAIGSGVYALVSATVGAAPSKDDRPVQFTISQGETAGDVATRLEREHLVGSAWSFNLLARLRGADQHLEAGVFSLRRNMTIDQVLDELQAGRYAGLQVTFPEGWRAAEMATLLDARSTLSGQAFSQATVPATSSYDFLKGIPAGGSLEGYLFPDTYRIPPGTTVNDLVNKMLANFDQKFTPAMRQQAAAQGMTVRQVVTLASVVEREAAVASERPLIAGVFLKRLQVGMLLQADSTVQYAKTEQPAGSALTIDYWPAGLTIADLQIDSPYNTYQHTGLPPGPICNPGLAAIKAVLEAPSTDYLYFVAKADGTHVFARTLEEHNQNVAKYQTGAGQ